MGLRRYTGALDVSLILCASLVIAHDHVCRVSPASAHPSLLHVVGTSQLTLGVEYALVARQTELEECADQKAAD